MIKIRIVPEERPSQIHDRMLATLPTGEDKTNPSFLFRSIFFKKLTSEICDNIMSMKFDCFHDMAIEADKLWILLYRPCICGKSRLG